VRRLGFHRRARAEKSANDEKTAQPRVLSGSSGRVPGAKVAVFRQVRYYKQNRPISGDEGSATGEVADATWVFSSGAIVEASFTLMFSASL
jgi:hypothetical protein